MDTSQQQASKHTKQRQSLVYTARPPPPNINDLLLLSTCSSSSCCQLLLLLLLFTHTARTCPPHDADVSISSVLRRAGMTADCCSAALPGRGGSSCAGSTRGATTKSNPHSRYSCAETQRRVSSFLLLTPTHTTASAVTATAAAAVPLSRQPAPPAYYLRCCVHI